MQGNHTRVFWVFVLLQRGLGAEQFPAFDPKFDLLGEKGIVSQGCRNVCILARFLLCNKAPKAGKLRRKALFRSQFCRFEATVPASAWLARGPHEHDIRVEGGHRQELGRKEAGEAGGRM